MLEELRQKLKMRNKGNDEEEPPSVSSKEAPKTSGFDMRAMIKNLDGMFSGAKTTSATGDTDGYVSVGESETRKEFFHEARKLLGRNMEEAGAPVLPPPPPPPPSSSALDYADLP